MPTQAPKILNVIIHHRNPPKGTSLRKSASFKLSTVKIRWAVWPIGELTESVTGTHTDTHTGKFIFCPCITLDRQKLCIGRRCDTVVKGHRNCCQSKACMRFPISLFLLQLIAMSSFRFEIRATDSTLSKWFALQIAIHEWVKSAFLSPLLPTRKQRDHIGILATRYRLMADERTVTDGRTLRRQILA